MVAVEVVTAPVKSVAAAARDDVDGAEACDAGRRIEVERGELEFLNHLLGKIHGGAASHLIVDGPAIDGEPRAHAAARTRFPELAPELAAGITRIKGVKMKGVRLGNWLSVRQAQELLNAPDATTNKGLRDRAMLVEVRRALV